MTRNLFIVMTLLITSTAWAGSGKYDVIGGPKMTPQEIAARDAKQKAEDEERDSAKLACIYYVKKHLNDPDSAEFPVGEIERRLHSKAIKQKNGTWKVTFTGRARNQFNALVMASFQCVINKVVIDGENYTHVISSKQIMPQ